MKKNRRFSGPVGPIFVLFAAAVFMALAPAYASAKDYWFPKVRVTADVGRDGVIRVTEERTFRFSGDFHWAFYSLRREGFSELADFSVADENGPYRGTPSDTAEPGTFFMSEKDGAYVARFYYSANDTDKTFTFRYRLNGVIKAYEDAADLYLKLVGTGWEKKTGLFEGYVNLPGETAPDRVYVFGHGPLQGTVERIGGRGARYSLKDLPSKTFVEARVIFPPELLDVPRLPGRRLESLLAGERGLARKTEGRRKRNLVLAGILAVIPLAVLALWFYLFFKYGREYRPREGILYYRDVPEDLPPALVGYLMRFKRTTPVDFTATIMSLVRKGHIALEAREEEKGLVFKRTVPVIYFSRTGKDAGGLLPHEKVVYDFLFSSVTYEDILGILPGKAADFVRRFVGGRSGAVPGLTGKGGDTVSSEDIRKSIQKHPREFQMIFAIFVKQVKKEGDAKEYFDKKSEFWMGIFTALAIVVPIACLIAAATSGLFFFVPVYFAVLFAFIFLIAPLARRTRAGAESYAKWNGLKKFLKDFSDLKTAPPASIAIWEYYLVYSVTFGMSKKVIKQLKVVLPQYSRDEIAGSGFFAGYVSRGGTFDPGAIDAFSGFVDSMVDSFNSISTAASTGSGGGFSGGGGGGAGGSGGGAG